MHGWVSLKLDLSDKCIGIHIDLLVVVMVVVVLVLLLVVSVFCCCGGGGGGGGGTNKAVIETNTCGLVSA